MVVQKESQAQNEHIFSNVDIHIFKVKLEIVIIIIEH